MNPGEAPDDLAGAAESSGLDRSIGRSEPRDESERAKEELRERYQELLSELRIMLPGVQVLVGFLLAVPFHGALRERRSAQSDGLRGGDGGRDERLHRVHDAAAYPRLGDRKARAARVRSSVHLMRLGLGCTAVALCAALFVVLRFIYGSLAAGLITEALGPAMATLWVVLPIEHRGVERGAGSEGHPRLSDRR